MKRRRMNLGDLNEEIAEFNSLYESGEIDEKMRDEMIEKATASYASSSSSSTASETTTAKKTQKRTKAPQRQKSFASKKKTTAKNDNCEDLRNENANLKKKLETNTTVIKAKDRSNEESASKPKKSSASKKKSTSTPEAQASKPQSKARSGKKKSSTSTPEAQASKPNAPKVTKAQENDAIKKAASKAKITQAQGKAVAQYSIIKQIAARFYAKKGKSVDEKWVMNTLTFIKKANTENKFNSKSPQFAVANKIYKSLLSQEIGKDKEGKAMSIGKGFDDKDWKVIEEVANSEHLPLTIQNVKSYFTVVKQGDTAKAKALLSRMNTAKEKGAIKTTDLNYKEWNEVKGMLAKNQLLLPERLNGIMAHTINGLSGFARSLNGLGSLAGITYRTTPKKKAKKRLGNTEEESHSNSSDEEVKSTSELLKTETEVYEFTGRWKKLMRNPGRGFSAMIYGMPGNGKTALSVQLANYLARYFGDVLYVSFEEHQTQSQKDNILMNGVDSDHIHWAKDLEGKDLNDYEFVFIDSVTEAGITLDEFRDMKEKYPETSFILIFQVTKEGKFRGEQNWEHNVDTVIEVSDFMAQSRKRYGTNELLGIK